jgi:hypothetical protein
MGQLGFFDLNRRYESLTEKNDPLVPGEATLTPSTLVRIQVAQPRIVPMSLRIFGFLARRNSLETSAR